MVDTGPLDLANFLARNRMAGGLNAQLANALETNLTPQVQATPQGVNGLFGLGQNRAPSDPGGRPRVGGGSLSSLAGVLSGGALAFPSMIGGLALNNVLGNAPSASLFGALRSAFDREERSDTFRDIGGGRSGRSRTGPRGERGSQIA